LAYARYSIFKEQDSRSGCKSELSAKLQFTEKHFKSQAFFSFNLNKQEAHFV